LVEKTFRISLSAIFSPKRISLFEAARFSNRAVFFRGCGGKGAILGGEEKIKNLLAFELIKLIFVYN
jgi:hypothetical protein